MGCYAENDDTLNRIVGRRLQEARQDKGLTQAAFARMAGLNQATITQHEASGRPIGIARLNRFAQLLGKPLAWFLQPMPLCPHCGQMMREKENPSCAE